MSVIHIGNDAFSEFVAFVVESDSDFNIFGSMESVVVVVDSNGTILISCCCGFGGGVSFPRLLLLLLLLAIISGYQLRTTRDNIAKDMKFKNGSNTFDNGCTHASVCDVDVAAEAMSSIVEIEEAGSSPFPLSAIIKGIVDD